MPSPLARQLIGTKPRETAISPLAGKPAPKELLVDLARLEKEYFERRLDMNDPSQRVSSAAPSQAPDHVRFRHTLYGAPCSL